MANNPSGSGITIHSLFSGLHKELPFSYLSEITQEFSHVIGNGDALGTVCKGFLQGGSVIAVKKHEGNAPGTRDLNAYRANTLSIMKHRDNNVASLLAFCLEVRMDVTVKTATGGYFTGNVVETLFCYEYYPKGNLHTLLFGDPNRNIDWSTRFKIIQGICRGLSSLHNAAGIIMHLNLKPQNILLDDNMIPKITDFVYSRIVGKENTRNRTASKLGSVGYKAPEYLYSGEISRRTDIYALGVMILEITTRERNSRSERVESATNYINEVETNWYPSDIRRQTIMSHYRGLNHNACLEVEHCIKIGLKCVSPAANERPTIGVIVSVLGA